jgi:hypothetical protein
VSAKAEIVALHAMFPDGRLCDTAIMWKRLEKP